MDLTRWYKRNDKFILASSFSLKKEMIFNEDNYDKPGPAGDAWSQTVRFLEKNLKGTA